MEKSQLQYICREQFQSGIPIFRSPYRSPEQIENVIPTLRKLMLDLDVPKEGHIAVLRNLPGRFTAPDELSFYLGFGDVLLRTEDLSLGIDVKRISTDDFMNRLITGTVYQKENEFSSIAASRFLLNSYILLSHPSVLASYKEVESNRGIYDIWAKKFPSKRGIEPVSEEILYGNCGKMSTAEVLESFLGILSGEKRRLPEEVKKDLNQIK